MTHEDKVPKINSRCACIVDRDANALAAVISSWLFAPGTYVPIFLFPRVKVHKDDNAAFMTEGYVANLMADHTSFLITNALARIDSLEYVILAFPR